MTTIVRPPGPGSALTGRRRAFLDDPTGFLLGLHREYGDVVYFRVGLRDNYLLSHPDDVKDVLVTNQQRFHKGPALGDGLQLIGENLFTIEGDTHRRHRKLIQPAFHRQRLIGFADVMVEESLALAGSIREGEGRDIAVDMAHVTLGVVMRSLFGTEMSAEARTQVTDFVRVLLGGWFGRTSVRRTTVGSEDYQAALRETDSIVVELIRERRELPGDHHDLLAILMEAQDEDGSTFSDQEVRDEIAALIAAGHETTSNALTWAWYLLSQNPEAEARMHREIDEVLGDRLPGPEDVRALPYVEMVFSEALRLIPPIWAIDRTVVEDHHVGGYLIPAGSVVFTSPYVVHQDPRWYPEPERFKPERWTSELRRSRPRFSYFPFGGGHRVCIGESFATMEAVLILATLGRRWRLRLEPGHPVETEALITLRPKHGMRMIPERRVEAS
jgi:cytochrome P450